MRYMHEKALNFWEVGYKLFHGKVCAPEIQVVSGQQVPGDCSIQNSSINFAVPSKPIIAQEALEPILQGVFVDTMKMFASYVGEKPKIARGKGKTMGDIDCWGFWQTRIKSNGRNSANFKNPNHTQEQVVPLPPLGTRQRQQPVYDNRPRNPNHTQEQVVPLPPQGTPRRQQPVYDNRPSVQTCDPLGRILQVMIKIHAVLFIDLDNYSSFFSELEFKVLPEKLFIIGFSGGTSKWRPPHSCPAFNNHLGKGLFYLQNCGMEKEATDEKLLYMARRLGVYLPPNRTFLIISGDGGFYRYIKHANRHVQIINPHQRGAREEMYYVILNHLKR
ncbi:uncharacterized protein LOC123545499 [Mercenaria mercenaria]|uniref:uncharacterized protein LOC123545499 n=1 Tax=Mercenaria mercenaria TaxID=6596 RepID=UPI00234E9FD5|nr:uncharacterized protein LOC123545499 [Mercenaria mercenaria]